MAATLLTPAVQVTALVSSSASSRVLSGSASPSLSLRKSIFGSRINSRVNRVSSKVVPFSVRSEASTPEEPTSGTTKQFEELVNDLKAKWDALEDKTSVFIYGGGAFFATWLSSAIVGAVNSVPLLPKFLELIGVGYTGWFIYRYLLFKSSRKELVTEINALADKITGATNKE